MIVEIEFSLYIFNLLTLFYDQKERKKVNYSFNKSFI